MTWSHHNPKLELFLVLKEYLHPSENLALSSTILFKASKSIKLDTHNYHFNDHP